MTNTERELLFAVARVAREAAMPLLTQLAVGIASTNPGEMRDSMVLMKERLVGMVSLVDALLEALGGAEAGELTRELAGRQQTAREALERILPFGNRGSGGLPDTGNGSTIAN